MIKKMKRQKNRTEELTAAPTLRENYTGDDVFYKENGHSC